MLKVMYASWWVLTAGSFLLGLISLAFSGRETIWKALGLWGLALGAGIASLLISLWTLRIQGQERAALRAAGKEIAFNDMPGFGQALLAMYGVMYFAAILTLILIVFAISAVLHLRRGSRGT